MPVVRLTELFRHAAASRIIINAHRINQGAMPDLSTPAGDGDFYFVPAEDPETAVLRIVHRHHERQAARGSRGPNEGRPDRGEKPLGRRRWSKLDERLRLSAASRRHIEPQSILPFNDRSFSPAGAMLPLLAKNQRSPLP